MYVYMFAYASITGPNSESNVEDEVHMTTDIVYIHGLRNCMPLTHANARAIMVHCECTRVYQSGFIAHVQKRYWTNLNMTDTCKCNWTTCARYETVHKGPING
jgi:hypothetical protein